MRDPKTITNIIHVEVNKGASGPERWEAVKEIANHAPEPLDQAIQAIRRIANGLEAELTWADGDIYDSTHDAIEELGNCDGDNCEVVEMIYGEASK